MSPVSSNPPNAVRATLGWAAGVSMVAILTFLAPAGGQSQMVEAPPLSNEALADRANVIVHGRVESIAVERVLSNLFDDRSYVATFVVDRVEQGLALEPGARLEVRYWRRAAFDESAADSVAGFLPLPSVGAESWLFATEGEDGVFAPVMPNGWQLDSEPTVDPTGLYGGTETFVRDQRTGSMTPWAIGMFAASLAIGAAALRVGPQSRPAVLLVAAGVAFSGVILLVL